MSRANGARRLDLKLHLSLPARGGSSNSASRRMLQAAPADDEDESSPSSCVSSEGEQQHGGGGALQWSDSPEATSMVLAACPRCFLYVMLAEADPRCPRCRSPVILDFLRGGGEDEDEGDNRGTTTSRRGRRNKRE
uniref:Uncharacterized protein n=1 Tax=Avena sativa TaxID=4498 RepID=A0ACD5ZBK6_AVESA